MICPACGSVNEDGALFCDKCKSDLEMPATVPPLQAATPMTDQLQTPAAPPTEEPIPLEPITLEPVVESAFLSPAAESPSAPPSAHPESTGDLPAVAAPPI